MIISFTKLNNIQNDINVLIDGKNTEISFDEKEKITRLFEKYKQCDIIFILKNCNDSYLKALTEVGNKNKNQKIFVKGEKEDNIFTSRILDWLHSEYYLQLSSINEYNVMRGLIDLKRIEIQYGIYKNIKDQLQDKEIILELSNFNSINDNEIKKIKQLKNIKGILINNQNINGVHLRNLFSIEEIEKVYNELIIFRNIANNGNNELEKFKMAYYLIGKNINYDFNSDGESSRESSAHSLKGALLNKKAVCEGYSYALSQLLNMLEIKNECVVGVDKNKSNANKHVWNQVFINGKWYNCDITNDSINIKEGRQLDYCLLSDKEFFLYKSTSKNAKKCVSSLNIEKDEIEK